MPPPPRSTLFPYTTLFRSKVVTKSGTKTKHVAMAMPQSAVITKKIMLPAGLRSEEHTSELQSRENLVCRLLLEKKKKKARRRYSDLMIQEVWALPAIMRLM